MAAYKGNVDQYAYQTQALCNADSPAGAGTTVYTVGTPGGLMDALDQTTGTPQWVSPLLDGMHYESVSFADGVIYTIDSKGFLDGFDAATGAPVLHRSLSADTSEAILTPLNSAGVAIARHTVYVADGGDLIAYRPSALPVP